MTKSATRRVPTGAGEAVVAARALDQPVLGLKAAPRDVVGQVGQAQLDGGNRRRTKIALAQRHGDGPETGHHPVERDRGPRARASSLSRSADGRTT